MGDFQGHEFRGNQWTGGTGGVDANTKAALEKRVKEYDENARSAFYEYAQGSHSLVNGVLKNEKQVAGYLINSAARKEAEKIIREIKKHEIDLPPGTIVYRGFNAAVPSGSTTQKINPWSREHYADRRDYESDLKIFRRESAFIDKFKPGATVKIAGVQSSSLSPRVGARFAGKGGEERRSVIFEIHARRGTYLGSIIRGNEQEVVLPHNARYRVERVRNMSIGKNPTRIVTLRQL